MNKPIPIATRDAIEELRKAFGPISASSLSSITIQQSHELYTQLGQQLMLEYLERWQKETDEGSITNVYAKNPQSKR